LHYASRQRSKVSQDSRAGPATESKEKARESPEGFDSCDRTSVEGTELSANTGRESKNSGMRQKSLRLNAARAPILDRDELDYDPVFACPHIHTIHKEKEKGSQKERERLLLFLNKKRTFLSGGKEDISIGAVTPK
jgi:hypothetical protein